MIVYKHKNYDVKNTVDRVVIKETTDAEKKKFGNNQFNWKNEISSVRAHGGSWTLKSENGDVLLKLCEGEKRPDLGKHSDKITSVIYEPNGDENCNSKSKFWS